MPQTTPKEASWEEAPSILDGATNLELTPALCHLDYWIEAAPQGTLAGLINGHRPETRVPDYMLEDGPLRAAIMDEFSFRSISEEKATRAISYLVAYAPDVLSMEFFGTQMIDEARHSRVFRGHLLELGVPEKDLAATIQRIAGADSEKILVPLEDFALPLMRDQRDFIAGVVILTILVEGVLAPSAELSELKWRHLDPPAAEIEHGANIDEVRHLTVGSAVVKEYLEAHPDEVPRVLDIITRGRQLWAELPTDDPIFRRELLFQEGMKQHQDKIEGYEIWPGRLLSDTTPEERLETANRWSTEMQDSRLRYMGLEEAIP
ncbi:MAG: VlmB-like protein [Acidobacteriota bacterium]